ncbi:Regulator of chromosome condensation (RCC1) repeat, putative, partial [Plasmodium malariae]
ENGFLDYNSSSGDSDNLLFGNSVTYNENTNFLKPIFHCKNYVECCKDVGDKNRDRNTCNCNTCCSLLNGTCDIFSSCESDLYSSFDSDDSDVTYIKINDVDEINKNMNIKILLNSSKDNSFYVKKKNYSLKKISIDDYNIYNSVLYSSSYANQYLAYVLPDQKSSLKAVKKYFNQISNKFYKEKINSKFKSQSKENMNEEKRNCDEYKYAKIKYLHGEKQKVDDKGSFKKHVLSTKGKNERTLLDNNLSSNKFIYNFIHDIKTRIKFVDIYNGSDFVISINNFGHVYAWGNNKYGCLGTGDNVNRYAPTLINP